MPEPDAAALRAAHMAAGLSETDLAADPFTQFAGWFAEVAAAGLPEPNAMVLATAGATGRPGARTVLLKAYDDRGFVFFTNYGSRKGQALAANPQASLLFPWWALGRQVEVVGVVRRVSRTETAAYFATRPRGAQLAASASLQSAVLASREELDERVVQLAARYDGADVPRPEHWGGYRLAPEAYEFWQHREDRLHDRLRYRRANDGWAVERLSP